MHQPRGPDLSELLARLLDLEALGNDRYRGREAPESGGAMFGGQLLAQSAMAAALTTANDRAVHSLHGYFLRAGSVDTAVELEVERVRDGRSFSSRDIHVFQDGRELFRASLSFHVAEPGLSYSPSAMPNVPPPDQVTSKYNTFAEAASGDDEWFGTQRPIDILYINAPSEPEGVAVVESQKMWVRIPPRLPDTPSVHVAALAYISDATLLDHTLLPHGYRWQDPRVTGTSLDHAMWFHTAARADEWMLYDQRVEFTGGARGLASATLYSESGDTLATCVQEGLIRWTP